MRSLISALLALAVISGSSALADESESVVPSSPPPAEIPPQPAPAEVPAPPESVAEEQASEPMPEASPAEPAAEMPSGQWAFTSQYGWVWMPYAQAYTYVPEIGDPYMYVFYPSFGWRWVVAPWVFGWGPLPYWGNWGVTRFAWHAHPWFHAREYRGHYQSPRWSGGYHPSERHFGTARPGHDSRWSSGQRGHVVRTHPARPAGHGGRGHR